MFQVTSFMAGSAAGFESELYPHAAQAARPRRGSRREDSKIAVEDAAGPVRRRQALEKRAMDWIAWDDTLNTGHDGRRP